MRIEHVNSIQKSIGLGFEPQKLYTTVLANYSTAFAKKIKNVFYWVM